MYNLQIRGKGIRQPSSSKSSRRHLAITGDLDQVLSKYHSYNLSQVIKHSCGGNDSNPFSIHFWIRDEEAIQTAPIKSSLFCTKFKLITAQNVLSASKWGGQMCFRALVPVLATGHLQKNQDIQPSHLHLLLYPPGMKGSDSTLKSLYPLSYGTFPAP